MRPPRILQVIDHTVIGGAQVVVYNILNSLRHTFSLQVVVLGKPGVYSRLYRQLGVPVTDLAAQRWDPFVAWQVAKIVEQQQIDLIHAHLNKSYMAGAFAAKFTKRPLILHDHTGMYPQTLVHLFSSRLVAGLYQALYRAAVAQSNCVLVLTQADLDAYHETYAAQLRRVIVMPNAINLADFTDTASAHRRDSLHDSLGLSSTTQLVMMVARLHPRKGWPTFLKIAQEVQGYTDRSCAFLVVGSGEEEAKLRELVEAWSIPRVFFLGFREDVPWLLRHVDVFLLTSTYESFGIVILEAMVAGCPVVATRTRGANAIITDGIDGMMADVDDAQQLSKCVLQLLEDRSLRKRLIENARRAVAAKYALQPFAQRLSDVYGEVLRS